MKTKSGLITKINQFKQIKSVTGKASYSSFKIQGNMLSFKRDNTGEQWQLNVDDIYEVYTKESFINTTVLRRYISGRTYSPSLAILIASGFCDVDGNRKL